MPPRSSSQLCQREEYSSDFFSAMRFSCTWNRHQREHLWWRGCQRSLVPCCRYQPCPTPSTPLCAPASRALHVGTDILHIDELAVLDRPSHHVGAVRIAVLIKAKRAGHALKILGLTYSLKNRCAVFRPRPLHGIQGHNGGLIGVHGPANGFALV